MILQLLSSNTNFTAENKTKLRKLLNSYRKSSFVSNVTRTVTKL